MAGFILQRVSVYAACESETEVDQRHCQHLLFHYYATLPPAVYRNMARYHETPTRRAAAKVEDDRQKYSLYLPLHPKPSRKGSVSKHDDKAKKDRESVNRASVDPSTGRRRGTIRSKEHDDEEEQLQRAIEESKREVDPVGGTSRRTGKRARDDSSEE